MSGSFDKPTGFPGAPPRARLEAEHYPGVRTQPATTARRPAPASRADTAGEARTRRAARSATTAPIVPAGSVTGRSLTLVITIMCFLASLTAGAVYMMVQSA